MSFRASFIYLLNKLLRALFVWTSRLGDVLLSAAFMHVQVNSHFCMGLSQESSSWSLVSTLSCLTLSPFFSQADHSRLWLRKCLHVLEVFTHSLMHTSCTHTDILGCNHIGRCTFPWMCLAFSYLGLVFCLKNTSKPYSRKLTPNLSFCSQWGDWFPWEAFLDHRRNVLVTFSGFAWHYIFCLYSKFPPHKWDPFQECSPESTLFLHPTVSLGTQLTQSAISPLLLCLLLDILGLKQRYCSTVLYTVL